MRLDPASTIKSSQTAVPSRYHRAAQSASTRTQGYGVWSGNMPPAPLPASPPEKNGAIRTQVIVFKSQPHGPGFRHYRVGGFLRVTPLCRPPNSVTTSATKMVISTAPTATTFPTTARCFQAPRASSVLLKQRRCSLSASGSQECSDIDWALKCLSCTRDPLHTHAKQRRTCPSRT